MIRDNLNDNIKNRILDTMKEIEVNTQENMISGALALKELDESLVNYLPRSGGAMTGSVVLNVPDDKYASYRLKHKDRDVELLIANGFSGVFENKFNSWMIFQNNNGTVEIPHTTKAQSITLTQGAPITFTALGEGTYNIGMMYVDQYGVRFETPRATDEANGEVLPFSIMTRGGQEAPLNAGDMYSHGNKVLTSANFSYSNGKLSITT